MFLTSREFRDWPEKRITLLGMSGVGKTTLSEILENAGWFHYSADYRIGTAYLDAPILENIHRQVRHIPFVRRLLDSQTIKIQNNITIDNLQPLSSFIGQIGNPERGGLSLSEFKRRQALYREGEIAAMHDVPAFVEKATRRGHTHFINDSSGSLCELEEDNVVEPLAESTLILYIKATEHDEAELLRRAQDYPKPLYFPTPFLAEATKDYMAEKNIEYIALIEPNEFSRWVFPRLFHRRLPKYQRIADSYGYTVTTDEVRQVKTESDFIDMVAAAIERRGKERRSA